MSTLISDKNQRKGFAFAFAFAQCKWILNEAIYWRRLIFESIVSVLRVWSNIDDINSSLEPRLLSHCSRSWMTINVGSRISQTQRKVRQSIRSRGGTRPWSHWIRQRMIVKHRQREKEPNTWGGGAQLPYWRPGSRQVLHSEGKFKTMASVTQNT